MTIEKLQDEPGRLAALQRYQILDAADDEPFQHIVSLARAALGVPIAAVNLIDAGRQHQVAGVGIPNHDIDRDDSFCTVAIKARDPLLVQDATLDPRFASKPAVTSPEHIRSYLGVPLETPDGYNLGAICAMDTVPRSFTEAQVALMQCLAKLTIEHMELRQIAKTDYLTGALTRRGFLREVERDFARSSRYGRPSALVFLDLDHFKAINDQHGHPAGDEVLRAVSTLCNQTLRQSDCFGRLGGEEFGLLLPETGPEDAVRCAERLRTLVEGLDLRAGGQTLGVTVSCGVAPLTPEIRNAAMWFAAADVALYQAKRGGRNQTQSADPTVLTPPKRALTDRFGLERASLH